MLFANLNYFHFSHFKCHGSIKIQEQKSFKGQYSFPTFALIVHNYANYKIKKSVKRRCWVNFQCQGVLLHVIWIIVGQGPTVLAAGAG